jgi:hypothetical protein
MINQFDFVINQNNLSLNNIALQKPRLREPLRVNPWIKPRENLYDALSNMDQLVAVTDSLKSGAEGFLSTVSIDDDEEHDDEEFDWNQDPDYVNRIYRSKQHVSILLYVQYC